MNSGSLGSKKGASFAQGCRWHLHAVNDICVQK